MGLTLDWTLAVTTSSIVCALVSLICRTGHMRKGETRLRIFFQHLILGAGLAFALALPARYALMPLALAVSLFLTLGAPRWRDGAPDDTRKENPTWK